ncbi:RNA-binding protein 34 [Portunus trituberculatus]|uniref:RNA-binding protein 34 n=1 Tax=Portunus trituberculatus TaxID=210409 RepID=A0A5B7EHP0_PORTR|nr:RNA-binding protein 34 [Portunus trituberculatus]
MDRICMFTCDVPTERRGAAHRRCQCAPEPLVPLPRCEDPPELSLEELLSFCRSSTRREASGRGAGWSSELDMTAALHKNGNFGPPNTAKAVSWLAQPIPYHMAGPYPYHSPVAGLSHTTYPTCRNTWGTGDAAKTGRASRASGGNVRPVDAVRLRCAAVPTPGTTKRQAVIMNNFHEKRTSLSAYVRFTERAMVEAALKANGAELDEKHLHIDRSQGSNRNTKLAVFIGNLAFGGCLCIKSDNL